MPTLKNKYMIWTLKSVTLLFEFEILKMTKTIVSISNLLNI